MTIDLSECICAIPAKPPQEHPADCPVRRQYEAEKGTPQPLKTFRVRQAVTYYVETTVEAPSKEALFAYVQDFDLEEQFEDVEAVPGPFPGDIPEVSETDKPPQWRLEGGNLVPIKKRVV